MEKEGENLEEINVVINQTVGTIDFNFDAIKKALAEEMSVYANLIVTEDAIADAKKDIAELRKLRKEIEDKRKVVKKAYNEPYDKFESKVKELLAEIDKPIEQIDTQVKKFNEQRIIEKQARCLEIYKEMIGEFEKFLPYTNVAKPQWDNATYSEKDVSYDISEAITKIKSDLEIIKGLNSEIYESLIETYIKYGNNLAKAVERNSQYIADKNRIEEQKRLEEERRKAEDVKQAEIARQPEMPTPVMEESQETVEPFIKTEGFEALNDIVEMTKTVKITILASDLEQVKEYLDFSEIRYHVED